MKDFADNDGIVTGDAGLIIAHNGDVFKRRGEEVCVIDDLSNEIVANNQKGKKGHNYNPIDKIILVIGKTVD